AAKRGRRCKEQGARLRNAGAAARRPSSARARVPRLQEVDERLQLGGDVRAARVIEEHAGEWRAPRGEGAHALLLSNELAHAALRDVGEADPVDGGPDHEAAIVDDHAPLDGNLEVFAAFAEFPAIDGRARRLAIVDAVVRAEVSRMLRLAVPREIIR